MSYPYNYFITQRNISKNDLEDVSYLFNKGLYNSRSILELYRKEINEYIENNKIKIYELEKNNSILSNLSKYYNDYLIKVINPKLFNPKLFFTFFIDYKIQISDNINNINLLKKLFELITIKNTKEYNEKISFMNPLNYYYLSKINPIDIESIINKKYINLYHINKSTNFISNINKTIQVLIQGNNINLSLPTIGIIYNQFNNENIKYTIVDFIEKIVTIKEEHFSSVCSHISLKELNLGNVFVDILFKNNNTNNPVINTFKNMINNININLIDILTIKSKNKTSKNIRLIRPEFIIPYKHIEKKNKDDVVLLEKNDYDKFKKSKDLIDKNNTIIIYVLNKIKNDPSKLVTNNYKNVLACYLFYIINLTTEIYNVYIDKIDDFLKNLIESRHNLFTDLNIIEAFNYTSLFKKSIYKFKLILLNNFHAFFLPTQILNGSYGMKINEYGSYIPESVLLGDTRLIEEYPFNIKDNNIYCNKIKLQKYILNISYKTDIYDKNNILEIGGNIYDFELLKRSMLILLNYYNNLAIKNNFNLFIINLLYDTWKNKNIIPIEIINDILSLDKSNKSFFESNILLKYEDNIQKCVFYITIVQNIRSKIKSNINNTELNRLENINLLSYIIYNMRCLSIIAYIKNSFIEINLKNKILEQILIIKNKYEGLISK